VLSHNRSKVVPDGGVLLSPDELDSQTAVDSYFFVLDGDDKDMALEMLREIRSQADIKIYLKPVVLGAGIAQKDAMLSAAVDIVSHSNEESVPINAEQEEIVNAIRSTKCYQQKIATVLGQQQLSLRILRFMDSRQHVEQVPVHTPDFLGGYSYPMLDVFFSESDASIWEMLEVLQKQHLIGGRFISKAYHCIHCECAFLNFMETCPDCGSPDIESDDLIHHFRCGYAGPMNEFKRGDSFVCPKCDLGLKQIGVDYDKPSLTFKCNECQYVFEEPVPSTLCYNCGRRTAPEDQAQRTVSAYSITALGSNIALYGQEQLFTKLLRENLELIDNDGFHRLVVVEIARIERYKISGSCILILDIKGLADALVQLGDRGIEFYKDIANAFVAELRSSDIMTIAGRSVANVLLTETDVNSADIVLKRLMDRVDNIFNEALSAPSGAVGRIIPVNGDLDMKTELQSLI